MLFQKKPRPILPRENALGARPKRLPALRIEPAPNGGATVTVELLRTGVMKFLSTSATIEKKYQLDPVGWEVWEACDGKNRVQTLVDDFARKYGVGRPEAETAVTRFLATLMRKGLLVISLEDSHG